ncbi:MAG: phosphatase PAP2 family protein [Rhodoglobus sp.]|nr:phosphatase PAP2 family protein [Rhodoglobus sp.]
MTKGTVPGPTVRATIAGGTAFAAVVILGLVITLRASPFGFDDAWMHEVTEHRSDLWLIPSLVMNFLGGGWFGTFLVPLGVPVVLLVLRRPWTAGYFFVASALSGGLVQVMKATFGRVRPLDVLVQVDLGSFPSGHVANAATVAVALALILRRTWVWVAGVFYVILMALSRTYLGAHWVSDTIGGIALGAAVSILLWAIISHRLEAESWRRHNGRDSVTP